MRRHLLLTGLFVSICVFSFGQSKPYTGSIAGLWTDSNSVSFQNCYLIISEQGNEVSTSHYLEFNGQPMVEQGIGKREGNKVAIDVKVTLPIPGWATTGKHILYVSNDGIVLRGEYSDAKGNRGPLVFKKKK